MVGVGVRGFDKGSWPVLRTFDYRPVAGVGTFEFHPIRDANLGLVAVKDLVTSQLTVAIPCPSCLKGG